MAGKDTLYRLIKSLNQSEKGYFKKFASLYSGDRDNNYIRLFEAIEKQSRYNEKAIKHQFEGERFTNNFSAAKNYLTDAILRSLKSFHGGKSQIQRIKSQLTDAQMMFKKGFFDESDKLLLKAYEAAKRSEEFLLMQEIIAERIIIVLQNTKKRDISKVSELIAEQEQVGKVFSNMNSIALLYYEIFKMRIAATDLKNIDSDRVDQIMAHPLLRSDDRALSLKAKSHFYLIHQYFAEMKSDGELARDFALKYLNLLRNNPKFTKRRDAQNIIFGIYNYLSRCRETRYYQDIDMLLEELEAIKPEYLALKIFHTELLFEVRLVTAIHTRNFESIDSKIDEIVLEIEKRNDRIRAYYQQCVFHLITIIRIIQGRFQDALDMNLITLEFGKDPATRGDFDLAARTLNLILHLELGNELLVPNLSRSLSYQIKKQEFPLRLERYLLQSVNKIAQSPKNEAKQLLIEFLTQIRALEDEGEISNPIIEHFDLPVWVQSRIEHVTMMEIYQRKQANPQPGK